MNLLKICNEVVDIVEETVNKMTQEEISKEIMENKWDEFTIGIDKAAEEAAIEVLKNYDVHLISEEIGEVDFGTHEYYAILDPIDGSKNAERGIPCYTISIALATENNFDSIQAGVIKNFITKENYYAEKGKGAFLGNKKLQTSNRTELKDCLSCFCTMYRDPIYAKRMTDLFPNFYDIRRFGTNAYMMCLLANGNIDVFIKKWPDFRSFDLAAGYIIAKEAGAVQTDIDGNPAEEFRLDDLKINGLVTTANQELHKKVLNLF